MGRAKKKKQKKAEQTKEKTSGKAIRLITHNRKAKHLYSFDQEIEAGLVLTGTEVKSCRANKVNLSDAYADEKNGEYFLRQADIAQYKYGHQSNHEPKRSRKLLLKQTEINKLFGKTREKGLTLVPIKMYFKGPWVKVLLGLGKGKKLHDKRASLRDKVHQREIERGLKSRKGKI